MLDLVDRDDVRGASGLVTSGESLGILDVEVGKFAMCCMFRGKVGHDWVISGNLQKRACCSGCMLMYGSCSLLLV